MRAAIYCRISADREGSGLGVDRQRADCEALADRLGWTVAETFTDNDISAYSGKPRPGYRAMLDALEAGRVEAVLAWHTDRLHRSPVELEEFIDICDRRHITVRTVQAGELDLSTPAGQMTARIVGAVARHEVDHARKRMLAAHRQAAAQGKWTANRPVFGYLDGGVGIEPTEAAAIRAATTAVLSGVSLRQIAREWNAQGLQSKGKASKWTASAVRRILGNPRYAALQQHQGRVVGTGNWEPIITEDEHRALLALFSDPARSNRLSYERRYQGAGIYHCGRCGAPMQSHQAKGDFLAYRCSATAHLSRQAVALDEYVTAVAIGRLSRPDARLVLEEPDRDLPGMQIQLDGLQARLEELASLFADGVIDGSQLARGTAELRAKIDALAAELAAARMVSPVADLVLAVDKLTQRWGELSADVRGKVIDTLMTVTVLPSPHGLRRFDPEYIRIEWKA